MKLLVPSARCFPCCVLLCLYYTTAGASSRSFIITVCSVENVYNSIYVRARNTEFGGVSKYRLCGLLLRVRAYARVGEV